MKNNKKLILFSILFLTLFLGGVILVGAKGKNQLVKAEASEIFETQTKDFKFIINRIISPVENTVSNVMEEVKIPVFTKEEYKQPASTDAAVATVKEQELTQPIETPRAVSKNYTVPSYNAPFQWGINMRPSGLGNYNLITWQAQLAKAKTLGTGWVRMDWDYRNADPFTRNTEVINAIKASGLNVLMVIEHNSDLGNGNLYQDGFNDGKKISSYYKGKVNYFQMANEGGAYAVKSATSYGTEKSDYDEAKYQIVKEYIRGLSDGIKAGNPDAVKVVNFSWTHTGYIEKIIDDVQFDMIGLDWYGWMGSMGSREISENETFFERLKSFGKPLTIMETNAMPERATPDISSRTVINEEVQAKYISDFANWCWENREWVKGYYVLELVDNVNVPDDRLEYFGLIKASINKATGTGVLGAERKSFSVYKDLISRLK